MPTDELRFGLIGYGLFGKHHAGAIAGLDHASLAAIAVKSEESRAAARADHPDAEVYADYRQMLERDDIDVADIVVPNQLHYDVARVALEHGKHVLVEKPMALTVEQCDELLALAERRGKKIAVGHELRLSKLWGRVRELIDEGAIGQPQHALVELSRFPYRGGAEGWRYDIDRVGSWVLEEPIHFFDLARWYLQPAGEPASVYARGNSRQAKHAKLYDNFTAVINHEGGAYAVVSQTLAAFGHHVTAKVVGTEGAIVAWWSAADARSPEPEFGLQYGLGDEIQEVEFAESTGELIELKQEIEALVRSIREGGAPAADGADGRWSVALCLAAEESIEAGKAVSVGWASRTDRPHR